MILYDPEGQERPVGDADGFEVGYDVGFEVGYDVGLEYGEG